MTTFFTINLIVGHVYEDIGNELTGFAHDLANFCPIPDNFELWERKLTWPHRLDQLTFMVRDSLKIMVMNHSFDKK